jgi:hypothetical protein
LPSLLIRVVGHTRSITIGCHGTIKILRVSLVALLTSCVARADEQPWASMTA